MHTPVSVSSVRFKTIVATISISGKEREESFLYQQRRLEEYWRPQRDEVSNPPENGNVNVDGGNKRNRGLEKPRAPERVNTEHDDQRSSINVMKWAE